jgi:F420-dependent oxidoreductase-like protein
MVAIHVVPTTRIGAMNVSPVAPATFPVVTVFGVHSGLQHISMPELRSLWRRIEELGFGWISIWDHFYAATFKPDDAYCQEAVAAHAALAADTSRVRCGSLVYCAGYRHPAVLAKTMCTIDQISGGRCDFGIGAGWAQVEYDAYGIDFPAVGKRMDILEESIQCVRGLLRNETTNFSGTYFTLTDARCEPRPVQDALPIWVGGQGEQRTLRIAARYADAWNIPFVSPETFVHKRSVLHRHCETIGRDPAELRCAVNVGIAWTEESLQQQFGALANAVRPGVLTGSDGEVLDRIGEYVAGGADQVNLAVRAPINVDDLERFAGLLELTSQQRT